MSGRRIFPAHIHSSFLSDAMRFSASAIAAASVCGFEAAGGRNTECQGNTGKEPEKRYTPEHPGGLEWSLEIAFTGLAKDVNRDRLGVVQVLEARDRLHEQRLRVLEVAVQKAHHEDAHER